jgi:hypothetical protein
MARFGPLRLEPGPSLAKNGSSRIGPAREQHYFLRPETLRNDHEMFSRDNAGKRWTFSKFYAVSDQRFERLQNHVLVHVTKL